MDLFLKINLQLLDFHAGFTKIFHSCHIYSSCHAGFNYGFSYKCTHISHTRLPFFPTCFFIYLHFSKLLPFLQLTISPVYQSLTTRHQQHPEGFYMQYWRFPLELNCLWGGGDLQECFVHQETDMKLQHPHRKERCVVREEEEIGKTSRVW